MVKPPPSQSRRCHRSGSARRFGRAVERVQAEPATGDLTRDHAVDLDRLAVAVGVATKQKVGRRLPESLTTHLIAPDGTKVATAKFEFTNGYVKITLETTGQGALAPGFHGVHIHSVGKCEANSAPPTGGAPGDFLSAGGHFQAPGHTGDPESGDLTSLQVRKDGGALLVTTTDAFTKEELLAGAGTSIVIHAGSRQLRQHPFGSLHPGQRIAGPRPDHDVHR